jgi:hypothetical protein
MQKVMKLLLVIVCLTVLCRAQDAPPQSASDTTGSMPNGRRWQALSNAEKLAWIDGYVSGVTSVLLDPTRPPDGPEVAVLRRRMFLAENLSYGEGREALDHFYATPENRPIPIALGMKVVTMNARGVPQSEIDDFVSALRRIASTDAAK